MSPPVRTTLNKGDRMSNKTIEYHAEHVRDYKAAQEEAFHKLTKLAEKHGMPYSVVLEELIPLWVDGTFAANWKGWHERGLMDAKEEAGWSRRDCLTCDRTTEHDFEGVCQTCYTPVPEEVYA